MDAASGKRLKVIASANGLTIECYYDGKVTDVTNLTTPMTVIRGKPIVLKALRAGVLDPSPGNWSFQGSVAGELYWISKPYGMPYNYANYTLNPWGHTVNYIYTQIGTNLTATWSDTDWLAASQTVSTHFTVVDPPITKLPYVTDTKVTFNLEQYQMGLNPVDDSWVNICTLTIALPSAPQERYPFTPPPNIAKDAENASHHPLSYPLIAATCASGTIGDYGKGSGEKFYPDIAVEDVLPSTTEQWERRYAGNFHFGAEGAAENVPLWALIAYAEKIDYDAGSGLKSLMEVHAIEAGYVWWQRHSDMPLTKGANYTLFVTF
jgi:hypothetical protein